MNSVMIEIPFMLSADGKITFPSLNLLKIAEELALQKVLQCVKCGMYFVKRGNQKYCDVCRKGRDNS